MNTAVSDRIDLVFFDYPSSPCARRVRISLLEKSLPHRIELVDLGRQEQKSAAFKKINPWGKVPALVDAGHALWESNVITQYLDEAFEGVPLYPLDWRGYAQVRYWQDFELYFAQSFFMLMYQRVAGLGLRIAQDFDVFMADMRTRSEDPAFVEFMRRAYRGEVLSAEECLETEDFLRGVAQHLENTLADGRRYLSGQAFGQADISVYPRLRMFSILGISLQPFPHVRRWVRRVEKRPTVRRALSASEKMLSKPLVRRVLHWASHALETAPAQRSALQGFGLRLLRKKLAGDQIASDRARAQRHNRQRVSQPAQRRKAPPVLRPQTLPMRLQACADFPDAAALIKVCQYIGQPLTLDAMALMDSERVCGRQLRATARFRTPAMQFDEQTLVCGLAPILDVLARVHAQAHALLPDDPYQRARARIWIAGDADGEQKYLRDALDQWHLGVVLQGQADALATREPALPAAQLQRLQAAIDGRLCTPQQEQIARDYLAGRYAQVARVLENSSWLVGDEFGLADIVECERLGHFLRWCPGELPVRVQSWMAAVNARLQGEAQSC